MTLPTKKSHRFRRFLGWTFVLLIILGLAGYAGLRSYVHSAAFREMAQRELGGLTHSEVQLGNLNVSATTAGTSRIEMNPVSPGGWKGLEADGVQVALEVGALRQGVGSIPRIDLDQLRLELAPPALRAEQLSAPANAAPERPVAAAEASPGWLRSWIPTRWEIGTLQIGAFDLLPAEEDGVAVSGLKITGQPAGGITAWLLRGEGGSLRIPGLQEAFAVTSATAQIDAQNLSLKDFVLRWIGDSKVSGRGELPFDSSKGWAFNGTFNSLKLPSVLVQNWQGKASGELEGEFDIASQVSSPVLSQIKVRIKSGTLQNLPLLERVADISGSERFRSVVLDEASATVSIQGEITTVSSLVQQSNGLIRLEGDLQIQGRNVGGDFYFGVLPEALRLAPGAQTNVFTEQRQDAAPGFVWTKLRVSGTLDDPKEDLSNRLLAAAGKSVLVDLPTSILSKSLDLLEKVPGRNVIPSGVDPLGKGRGRLKGLVPLLGK